MSSSQAKRNAMREKYGLAGREVDPDEPVSDPIYNDQSKALYIMGENTNIIEEADEPELGYTGSFAKKVLSLINTMFFLVAISVIVYGIIILEIPSLFPDGTNLVSGSTALVIIIGGAAVGILALVGLTGVRSEVICMIKLYMGLLALLLFGQAVITILNVTGVYTSEDMAVGAWEVASVSTRADIQNSLGCCGLRTYNDTLAAHPCPTVTSELLLASNATTSSNTTTTATGARVPCLDSIVDTLAKSYEAFLWVWLSVAIIQVIALCLSFILMKGIRDVDERRTTAPLLLHQF